MTTPRVGEVSLRSSEVITASERWGCDTKGRCIVYSRITWKDDNCNTGAFMI